MDPSNVNWLAVAVAALLTFLLGWLWYSPLLFGPAWQRLAGLDDAQLQRNLARTFGGALLCALIGSTNLAFFLGANATVWFGLGAGAATGVGWVATSLTTTFLFERRPLALIAIDAGFHSVAYAMMGALLGAWH